MPLRGDFGKLARFAGGLRQMAAGALARRESELLTDARFALMEHVAENFLMQRSPDGKPWKPRKTVYHGAQAHRNTNPILFDLLSGFRFLVEQGKVVVQNPKFYWWYHQTGAGPQPERQQVPTKALPGTLKKRIELGAVRAMKKLLGVR